ncbi:MAG: hypothetical protein R6T98_05490 [Desulfatiglandales bacterium]
MKNPAIFIILKKTMDFFQFPPVEGLLNESHLKSLKRAFIRAHKSFSTLQRLA